MKRYVFLMLFILTSSVCFAQNEPVFIPRRIFIGDPVVMIIPVNSAAGGGASGRDIVLTPLSYGFPSHPDIDFHRIVLEQRTGGRRLIIEFTPFVSGVIELPVIEIEDMHFSGLTVTVNSILDNRASLTLSGPASSLAMPGTAFMLYGTITGLILFIILTIWFFLKGKIFINNLKEKLKRWRLFSSMKKMEKRLSKYVLNGEDSRLILDELSGQFRIFLSVLTGQNCQTMTAGEFDKLSLHVVITAITRHKDISSSFLHDFFRDCDDLRFSGIDAASQDILYLLACLRRFITAAENAEKENVKKVSLLEGEAA